ncbi:hypothetical protein NSK_008110 [Nannochloropsis salina CCMP1776]|uniref:Uncharacterized protein n=1 Tax=Nannochloropsis salina CCMP1776 TaxID=1027361 RepID=A0A4D9CPY8_9STRA|nr:hypothetical protein NSK_008110 [Nannochloropsis salina CCMP1776]|eukprot:TFJ80534.1 hypothetical protein NSK_008110 [Nannochloropsis salina CCMP1776]
MEAPLDEEESSARSGSYRRRSNRRRASSLSAMDEDSTSVLEGDGKARGKDRRKKTALLLPSASSPSSPATSAPPSAPPSVLATGLLSLIPNVPLHVASRNESYLETGGREGGKEGGQEGGAVDDGIAGAQRELLEAQGAYLRRILLIDWLVGWLTVSLKGTHPRSSSQPLKGWAALLEKEGMETIRRLKALHQSALMEVTSARVDSLHELSAAAKEKKKKAKKKMGPNQANREATAEGGAEGRVEDCEEDDMFALADIFPNPTSYSIRVVRAEGALVRDGPEPLESNRLRVLEAGTVVQATRRQVTAQVRRGPART